jgi:hypothetical protein
MAKSGSTATKEVKEAVQKTKDGTQKSRTSALTPRSRASLEGGFGLDADAPGHRRSGIKTVGGPLEPEAPSRS